VLTAQPLPSTDTTLRAREGKPPRTRHATTAQGKPPVAQTDADKLARRLAAARKRAAAADATPQPPKPPAAAKAKPARANHAKPIKPPTTRQDDDTHQARGLRGPADLAGIIQALRSLATNPSVLALLTDQQLVDIWQAMVANAATRGSTGSTDRQALFRAAGLPFQAGAHAASALRGGRNAGPAIDDRLAKALARVNGQASVTDDDGEGEEPPETADFAA